MVDEPQSLFALPFDIFATFIQVVKFSSVSPDAIVNYNAFTTNFVKGNGTRVNK